MNIDPDDLHTAWSEDYIGPPYGYMPISIPCDCEIGKDHDD